MSQINIPNKWQANVELVQNAYIIVFHKLSSFQNNFTRFIEKQLIITNGILLKVFN